MRRTLLVLVTLFVSLLAAAADKLQIPPCVIQTPPDSLKLNPFYKKYVDCNGIAIISSWRVPDSCLVQAHKTLYAMTCMLPKVVLKSMVDYGTQVAVMARYEGTSDLPEHKWYYDNDTTLNMDVRARGMEGTLEIPLTSCAEENVLAYQIDQYHAEDILIHEFAHSIHLIGLKRIDPEIDNKLQALMDAAIAEGKYTNTYALENHIEYWAEAVQNWFNVNAEVPLPDGKHNWVNCRDDLKSYDPRMYAFLAQYFPEFDEQISKHKKVNLYTADDPEAWRRMHGTENEYKAPKCKITPVPAKLKQRLNLSDFYCKYVDVNGIHLMSSWRVPDSCLVQAHKTLYAMTSMLPKKVLKAMTSRDTRVAVMARYEATENIPEHAFLRNDTTINWNLRARGLGGDLELPLTTCAEENILAYQIDKYHAEDILIHEFAHSIHLIGILQTDPDINSKLKTLLQQALAEGKYKGTYAGTNIEEYWAEGVQDWFNVNGEVEVPDGKHNHVNTRVELREYDPRLAELIGQYFPDTDKRISKHAK